MDFDARTRIKTIFSIIRLAIALVFLVVLCACGTQPQPATLLATAPSLTPTPAPVQTPETAPVPTPVQTTAPNPTATTAPSPTTSFIGQVVCTADEFVNIRENASADTDMIGTLPADKIADVIAFLDDWVYISYGDITGYVSRDYTVNKSTPQIPVPMGDWASILVSPTHYLPDDFEVSLADFENGQVDARILDICNAMFADAKDDGVDLALVDAYRSYDTQNAQYQKKVDSYISKGYSREDAEVTAATITARPDTSEHQTGLALDIVTPSYTKRNKGFAKTQAFKWLDANAHHYGFTLRYKLGKEDITGVIYESWHWRFVGAEAAIAMKKSGQCYEEYLGVI